jgi:hypothetical protein
VPVDNGKTHKTEADTVKDWNPEDCLYPPGATDACKNKINYLFDKVKKNTHSVQDIQELVQLQAGQGLCAKDAGNNPATAIDIDANPITTLQDNLESTTTPTKGELTLLDIANQLTGEGSPMDLSKLTQMLVQEVGIGSTEFAEDSDSSGEGNPVVEDPFKDIDLGDDKDFNF